MCVIGVRISVLLSDVSDDRLSVIVTLWLCCSISIYMPLLLACLFCTKKKFARRRRHLYVYIQSVQNLKDDVCTGFQRLYQSLYIPYGTIYVYGMFKV